MKKLKKSTLFFNHLGCVLKLKIVAPSHPKWKRCYEYGLGTDKRYVVLSGAGRNITTAGLHVCIELYTWRILCWCRRSLYSLIKAYYNQDYKIKFWSNIWKFSTFFKKSVEKDKNWSCHSKISKEVIFLTEAAYFLTQISVI